MSTRTKILLWLVRFFGIHACIRGKVEDFRFTFGGAGNQWTTIDGREYATYWDVFSKDWTVGDTVEFEVFYGPLMGRHEPVWQADRLRKIV